MAPSFPRQVFDWTGIALRVESG